MVDKVFYPAPGGTEFAIELPRKSPGDTRSYAVDLSAWLKPRAATLSGIVVAPQPVEDLTLSAPGIDSAGRTALFTLAGGADTAAWYRVRITATASNGEILEFDTWLLVAPEFGLPNAAGLAPIFPGAAGPAGPPGTSAPSYANFAALRAASVTGLPDGASATAAGYAAAGDGGGKLFAWAATSTAADNDDDVLQPTGWSNPGRWIAVTVARGSTNSGVYLIRLNTITDLAARSTAGVDDMQPFLAAGAAAALDGGGGLFVWSASSTAAPDGLNVINPTGNAGAGRYHRLGIPLTPAA